MSPFAASVSANGSTKAGPPAGLAFSDTVVRCPVTGFTRITPPPAPANALWSTTSRSPFGAMTTPSGSTKAGPPRGLVFSETVVRAPVVESTRMMPPVPPNAPESDTNTSAPAAAGIAPNVQAVKAAAVMREPHPTTPTLTRFVPVWEQQPGRLGHERRHHRSLLAMQKVEGPDRPSPNDSRRRHRDCARLAADRMRTRIALET